ncbi:MAG: hypothetical protein BJ554DRAFT_5002 [Olpidium bornovanus]|uniref:CBF1-interacting co-repressor CIR N-terminal domain-containing protein n=1 Tax=Olpidium bornovanus TaxID=278681 RepID=A0A8H7ZM03_9FUNG|nr:MAG: hypothetical protein BJ554DRAFT_5002 [Olpidium bornovanus]
MSFGSLNILQHKSWHVYNEKNREKVRRDEEEAAREAERKRQKAEFAESERRLVLLRAKAKTRIEGSVECPAPAVVEDAELADADCAVVRDGLLRADQASVGMGGSWLAPYNFVVRANPEREAEEKSKKERESRWQNVYLDQSKKERRRWYTMPKKLDTSLDETGLQRKERADPLKQMSKTLKSMKEADAATGKPKAVRGSAPCPSENSIDELRKARLLREQAERRKLELVLNPGLAEPPRPHREVAYSASSQYNPGLTLEAHRHHYHHSEERRDRERELSYRSGRRPTCRQEDWEPHQDVSPHRRDSPLRLSDRKTRRGSKSDSKEKGKRRRRSRSRSRSPSRKRAK